MERSLDPARASGWRVFARRYWQGARGSGVSFATEIGRFGDWTILDAKA
jgi:hypothetical protein